jgi:hypothetical protein
MAKQTFKILRGTHDESIPEQRDKDGNVTHPGVKRTFRAGDVFESEYDLLKLNAPGCQKFALLSGQVPVQTLPQEPAQPAATPAVTTKEGIRSTLEGMSVKELRDMAAAEEIDVTGLSRKEDLINALVNAA